ncbi:MAG: zinc-binding dehydrogenase [Planctomycetota bacterium]|nr:zinc-binding dehydrogenase [Planctomycetota bacterium]
MGASETAKIVITEKEKAELHREALRRPGDDEVLVRATCSLISTGTETICYGRRFAPGTHWDQWVKYPFQTGYSHVGVVEEVGRNVKQFKPGDRVGSTHAHSQYVGGSPSGFYAIPDGVSDRDAAWLTLSYIVQNGVRRAQHAMGEDVVIVGLGPLGQLALQFVRLLGARVIVAVDPDATRLEMARMHGATHTLAVGVDAAVEPVKEITKGRLADAVYDMTGNDKVFAAAQHLLRRFGKLVLIGDTGTPAGQFLTGDVIRKSLQIVASHATNTPPEETDWSHWTRANMIQLFYSYLLDGRMKVSDLNTHLFSPVECQDAYQKLLHTRAGTMGCHFDWTKV